MKLEHAALWTADLERCKEFYVRYFDASYGKIYLNKNKEFSSYFLSFSTGARLEIMHNPSIGTKGAFSGEYLGVAHLAFCTGSRQAVGLLTERLRSDGFTIVEGPRETGDGYYESVVLDPDGNRLEITS